MYYELVVDISMADPSDHTLTKKKPSIHLVVTYAVWLVAMDGKVFGAHVCTWMGQPWQLPSAWAQWPGAHSEHCVALLHLAHPGAHSTHADASTCVDIGGCVVVKKVMGPS